MLEKQVQLSVRNFLLKNIYQVVNAIFATVQPPKEAVGFIYERMYFAYASDKNVVVGNISRLEELAKEVMENDFKSKMLLKITRPLVKINFLVHAEHKVFEMMNLPSHFSIENDDNKQLIINFADKILSKFIDDMFKYKNEATLSNKDEIVSKVSKLLDAIGKIEPV